MESCGLRLTWLDCKSVKPFIDASTFQTDEIGQALILEDVLNSKELSTRLIFCSLGIWETVHLSLP